MRKNLTAIGNSLGLVIEKPILDLLGINKETQLEISTNGKHLIIKPVKETGRAEKIKAATRRVMSNHDETFRKLAK